VATHICRSPSQSEQPDPQPEATHLEDRSSPLLMRWILGERLREFREANGMTASKVASELSWAPSKISRIENHEGARPSDVRALLSVYGITDPDDIQPVVGLARQAENKGWWREFDDTLPPWFATFVGLEAGAAEERDYRGAIVTGLLQTEDYARALMSADRPGGRPKAGEVERMVALRRERQEHLEGHRPLRVWTIMEESALHRPVGGRAVMREQLRHLADISAAPHVTVQVLPAELVHLALDFPFCLLTFPEDAHLPGVVYLENFRRTLYLEGEENVSYYGTMFGRLTELALSPVASRDLVVKCVRHFDE
jgi:transcriptional regulator with XRE-family HTH domain